MTIIALTRKLHAFCVQLHIAALQRARTATKARASRTTRQTYLVQTAIEKRSNELVAEFIAQSALRVATITQASSQVQDIESELKQYEQG